MSGWIVRRLLTRAPTWLLLLGLAVEGAVRALVAILRQPWAVPVLTVAAAGWWLAGVIGPRVFAVATVIALLVAALAVGSWAWRWPGSYDRRLADPVRSWRRRRHYEARWADAVDGCGLVRAGIEPVLMSVRTRGGVDRLAVHMAPGSLVTDWREAGPRLASAFGVRSVRARRDGPGDVALLVRWREIRWADPETIDDLEAEVVETAVQDATPVESEPAEPEQPATGRPGAFPRRPR